MLSLLPRLRHLHDNVTVLFRFAFSRRFEIVPCAEGILKTISAQETPETL